MMKRIALLAAVLVSMAAVSFAVEAEKKEAKEAEKAKTEAVTKAEDKDTTKAGEKKEAKSSCGHDHGKPAEKDAKSTETK